MHSALEEQLSQTRERRRLLENTAAGKDTKGDPSRQLYWRQQCPYRSDRQWGTVREDYSASGTHGKTFPTIRRDQGPTAGGKMEFWGSTTPFNASALPAGARPLTLAQQRGNDELRFQPTALATELPILRERIGRSARNVCRP